MSTTTTTTKSSIARAIFDRMVSEGTHTRKDIMFAFMEQAHLTEAGASTYYANFKRKMTTTVVVVEAIAKPKFEDMTDIELAMFYAKHAPNPSTDHHNRDCLEIAILDEITFAE